MTEKTDLELEKLAMMQLLQNAMHEESAAHAPKTSLAIEVMRKVNDFLSRVDLAQASSARDEALEEAALAIVEPISAYIYDVLYKTRSPVTSHTHQKTHEAAQAAIRALKEKNDD